MGDGPAMCLSGNAMNCEPATADPLTWLEHKMRLARFLGINTFARDLLEFGFNQGWDSAPHGGNNWFYQSRFPQLGQRAVDRDGPRPSMCCPTSNTQAPPERRATQPPTVRPKTALATRCARAVTTRVTAARAEHLGGGIALSRCALPTYGFHTTATRSPSAISTQESSGRTPRGHHRPRGARDLRTCSMH